jgi:hypothetical protein
MVGTYLIHDAILQVIEAGINVVLRAIGGPDHVPAGNEDLVWF